MEQQGRGRRQVDLFNFSFLDILACVIGLLIFILTIVVISGGGASSRKKVAAVEQSEHGISDARASAAVAHDRRARLESLLAERAGQAIDPVSSAKMMRKETDLFDDEAQTLKQATAKIEVRLTETQLALAEAKKSPAAAMPRVAAIDAQAREIDQQAEQALADAADVGKSAAKKQNVRFYVPRIRETHRTQLWAEISGEQMWFLNDYEEIRIDARSSRYDRRASTPAIAVAGFTNGKNSAPAALADRSASSTLIMIAVRPDGFSAFRQFREWAWHEGFAINWVPFAANEPIILFRTTSIFQQ